jgi:hypothetical protein
VVGGSVVMSVGETGGLLVTPGLQQHLFLNLGQRNPNPTTTLEDSSTKTARFLFNRE